MKRKKTEMIMSKVREKKKKKQKAKRIEIRTTD